MTAQIHIPQLLRVRTDNQKTVAVNGETIGECLQDLVSKYTDVNSLLFDEEGSVRRYVIIFLNQENTFPKEMNVPVKDGDDIRLEIFLDGG